MQSTAYPVRLEILEAFWQSFMATGRVEPVAGVEPDPAVIQSWQRCALRLDPRARPRPATINPQALASVLKAQSDLITVAIAYIEDIHQFIEGSGCAVLLADGTACVLAVGGDPPAVELVNELGLGQGAYWLEGQLGSNALGVTLINAMPVQVVGAEHYFQAYHHLVSTAAPIHDVNGRIIGIMAVVGPAATATSHTLSLVMAAARAIGNQLQTNLYLEEANRRLTEVNTILESIVEGIIAWNDSGKINHINTQAAHMLGLSPPAVLGQRLTDVLNLPPALAEAMAAGQEIWDVEAAFEVNGQTVTPLVSLRPIFEGKSGPVGYMAMLRPVERVRQLVFQQVGAQATLSLDDIPAQSPAMRPVLRQARIAARGMAPVMLRGEGGVGKNHLARAIHKDSGRANKPFISINCRAIPHELMAGELLGYEKGVATDGRPSKFELADGGSLLLDQIESLSLEMQAALLHVIETGHVMRLGGTRPIPVDVRIIASTADNLEQLVAEAHFIDHLFYRFGVFTITIPPLRQRVEDISVLAERFLARFAERFHRPGRVDEGALDILCRYPWPGNVRELESALERAMHHSPDEIIRAVDLPDVVRNGRVITGNSPYPQPVLSATEAEREAIIRAGWACQGRVTEMARQLGIGRTTLWRKMKRHQLASEHFRV
ncbi:MAG: PTS-dependent dihydroxyacetone kinase operon transcriptional regulator DhaR [Chloroflexi bacterium]|nr:PTS-dependent dihydroxyacetone kinase operon transcriptional regulator DhaR [Chloroflexota bacterium]MCI0575334.1 PTS-dependent dihydroxyacetone kinase operon transcriptional regulator DhaR [Chloroflexota bacterium]MCI0647325.1 PTS-dependent dihydroxyacetone kinase operon transcriptional regulator DhaR [Chloroflexota bacterium]MCI0725790.1 PTS-dependent dihydroxyacetone kinase operon transcriptional regulator DhaR [Chloroflexota bacterium]